MKRRILSEGEGSEEEGQRPLLLKKENP